MDMRIGSRIARLLGGNARCKGNRASARARGERGQSLLEFAFVAPILATVLLGIIVFGIALNNYLEVTNAATVGVQALAASRNQTTDPCNTTYVPAKGATANLNQTNLLFTIVVTPPSGAAVALTASTASPSCPASAATLATEIVQGGTAQVQVTYPCNLKVFGVNFGPTPCTLTAQTAEAIQ